VNYVITLIALSALFSSAVLRCILFNESNVWRREDKVILFTVFVMYQLGLYDLISIEYSALFVPLFVLIIIFDQRIGKSIIFIAIFSLFMFAFSYSFPLTVMPLTYMLTISYIAINYRCYSQWKKLLKGGSAEKNKAEKIRRIKQTNKEQ
jgi:hypothetical protein